MGAITRRVRFPSALRRDPLLTVAALWTLLAVAVLVALGDRTDAQVKAFWLAQPPLDALLAYASWNVSRLATGAIRRFWRVLTVSGLLFVAGDTVQVVAALRGHGLTSTDGGAFQATCFGVGMGLVIIAMLVHPHPGRTGREKLAFWLDSATVLVGGAVVAWSFVITEEGNHSLVAALANSAMILTSAFAAVKMILSGNAPMHRAAAIPMIVSAGVNAIGLFAAPKGAEALPAYVFALRLLPSLLVAAGPRIQQIVAGFDQTAFGARRRKPYSLLPYGSIVVAFAALTVVLPKQVTNERVWGVIAGLGIICALVAGRQLAAFHDNKELIGRLDVALAELREKEARLRHQALFDGLTGLANRTHFHEEAAAALTGAEPGTVSLLLIDLDGFKAVNDTLGHAAGDALLAGVAQRLSDAVRPTDLVARLGGDEFAVLLRDCGAADAELSAQRVLAALTEPIAFGQTPVRANASIGVACADRGEDVGTLLRDADLAMYAAKHRGKGCWMRYEPSMADAQAAVAAAAARPA